MTRRQAALYYRNKEQGLCTSCGLSRERVDIVRCNRCHAVSLEGSRKYRSNGRNKTPHAAQLRHVWRRNRYRELMESVNRLKCSPCSDCRQTYNPWQMEFDHRDPDTKCKAIAALINRCCSDAILKVELEKCDLVCSNCHATRTHLRRQGKSYVKLPD